jgi:protein-S-isoprenylcysteine O-methyltransferase Ste14
MLVIVKYTVTGSILDKPKGGRLVWLVNIFNIFFLLVANPLAALLLITRRLESLDPTYLGLDAPWLLTILELGGLVLYVTGYVLMAWSLTSLGDNYQLGGVDPRATDELIIVGPYRFVRHPIYTAALCIASGLACLLQSVAYLTVFCIYLVLILLLIPAEENGLQKKYGEQYLTYQRDVKKLIPLFY